MESEPAPSHSLETVFEQITRLIRQLATAGQLSLTAAMVLARLNREGPQRLTELAVGEGLSQPGMTQLVTRLERDGLVHRTASVEDRRGVLVDITPTGRELVQRRRAERAVALRELLGRLDRADQEVIAAALPALARLVEGRRTHPPAQPLESRA
jgi:DNA-binding MarR family transcriptional regulator